MGSRWVELGFVPTFSRQHSWLQEDGQLPLLAGCTKALDLPLRAQQFEPGVQKNGGSAFVPPLVDSPPSPRGAVRKGFRCMGVEGGGAGPC